MPFEVIKAFNEILGRAQNVQSSFNMLKVIETEHARIHEGRGFSLDMKLTVAAGSHYVIGIDPSSAVASIHFRDYNFNSTVGPCDVYLYEASSYSGGAALSPVNNNRTSAKTANLILTGSATLEAAGTQLSYGLIESSTGGPIKAAGGSAEAGALEFVLDSTKKYAVRFINNNGALATIGFHAFWYEPNL